MRNDELMHYGVLGMKWGVRRYQNKDGSLTNAGEKKVFKKNGNIKRRYQKQVYGMTARQYRKALKNGDKTNYLKTRSEHVKALESNKKLVSASKKSTEAWNKLVAEEKNNRYNDSFVPSQTVLKNNKILQRQSAIANREYQKVGMSFVNKYNEATLKDVGFKGNIDIGKKMIKQYSGNKGYDMNADLDFSTKYGYKYEWNGRG